MKTAPTGQQDPPASYADFSDQPKSGPLKIVVQFFAIPVLIVGLAVSIFLGTSLLFRTGPKSAAEFVGLLRAETLNRRWQAAMELSAMLADGEVDQEFRDAALVESLVGALEDARANPEQPPRMARQVLHIFRMLKDPRSLEAVRAAADDEHPWIRSHALLVLGSMRDEGAKALLHRHLTDADAGARRSALVALAALDQEDGKTFRLSAPTKALARRFLGDEDPYVRCQAAILLGTAGDGSPNLLPLLAKMLDRNYLEGFPFDAGSSGITQYDLHSDLLLQTVGAVSQAKGSGDDPNIVKALNQLTNSDTEGDPAVRQAARAALNELRQHASE